MSLKNAVVVILGGSSGIGLATAKAAQTEGAHVVIAGRSAQRLQSARAELGDATQTAVLDVANEAATESFFRELNRIDHLLITAGTLVRDPRLAPNSATLHPVMDTRFWGALYAAKYGARKIKGNGSIVFTSGTAARRPLGGLSVTSASCGAVEAFARALAVDLAPVRVNVIQPGFVDTPLLDEVLGAQRAEIVAAVASHLPVGRIGRPDEIADAVLFLMKNCYVTGITLTIDGGGVLV
jgi:NAD(P)-dependent dehydrogenase (short-subunit alcohol dehydrogenase family)